MSKWVKAEKVEEGLKAYKVIFSYSVVVEAASSSQAETQGWEEWNEVFPNKDEFNVAVEETEFFD